MRNRDNKIKLNFSANGVSEDEWSFLIWVLVCKIIKMGKPSHSSVFAKGIGHVQISVRLHQSNEHSVALSLIQVNALNFSGKNTDKLWGNVLYFFLLSLSYLISFCK